MKAAVLYARVSSKEQEQGFSLESQERTGRAYAKSKGFEVVREFSYSESAKKQGRKHFNAMVDYLRENPAVRIVIVEKTDRLSRNLKDYVMLESLVEELGLEIHLVKEGQVLQTGSKSQDKLVQGMFALLARNYIQNLQEEVQKGQTVKAEKGQYPGRAPFGYAHDRQTRTIVAHPTRAGVVRLLFELHSTGWYTVMTLRKAIIEKTGERISKSYLHKILASRFYLGKFTWRGREYPGTHPPLVDCVTFERVKQIISNRSKRKAQRHNFAFSGLMRCAEDNCSITAELHKGKYTYYRCTFGRGKHSFPYMREEATANMLSMVLGEIDVPLKVARLIAHSSRHDTTANEVKRRGEISKLHQRRSALQTRLDKAYNDKLDGLIDEDFWQSKKADWTSQGQEIEAALAQYSGPVSEDSGLSVQKIMELARSARSLYLQRSNLDRAQLLRTLLCTSPTDGKNVYPIYREPFNAIFRVPKKELSSVRTTRTGIKLQTA